MIIIIHRVNTRNELQRIPARYGVEVDVRHDPGSDRLYLNHDPGRGEYLDDYLREYKHAFIIFNIKEAGIEEGCRNLAEKYGIPPNNYFLLDVEFPYLYRATREGAREIAVRLSEEECYHLAERYKGRADWLWIDTISSLPLNEEVVGILPEWKICLVSPDRWGRGKDIVPYRKALRDLGVELDAVMAGKEWVAEWEKEI